MIEVPGYCAQDKRVIAERSLIPELTRGTSVSLEPEAVDFILKHYENECGIRTLQHGLADVVKYALSHAGHGGGLRITQKQAAKVLGPLPYQYLAASGQAGCVNALAVRGNEAGVVMPISVTMLRSGEHRVTGLPEGAMRDSISVAESWVEDRYGYSFRDGVHVHFTPAGIQKDGPSAGAAIALAMLSAASGTPLPEGCAFTGEFDGRSILPVGGVALKVQAAESAGLTRVFLPEACREDVDTEKFKIAMTFVSTMDELVQCVFPHPIQRVRETPRQLSAG